VEPSQAVDIITPPGPWTSSGPLSRVCSQQHFPHQSFLRHSGSVYSEKWLYIQGHSCALWSVCTYITWFLEICIWTYALKFF